MDHAREPLANFDALYARLAAHLHGLATSQELPASDAKTVVRDVFATYLVQRPNVRIIERYLAAGVADTNRGNGRPKVARSTSSLPTLAQLVEQEDADAERALAALVDAPLRFTHAGVSRRLRTGGAVRFLCAAANRVVASEPMRALDISDAGVAIAEDMADGAYPYHLTSGLRGLAWKERANALRYLSQHGEALAACDRAEAAFRNQRTNVWELAVVQYVRATVHRSAERYREALIFARESAAVFERYGDVVRRRSARLTEAASLQCLRHFRQARELYRQLLREAQGDGDLKMVGYAAMNLGDCETSLHEFGLAKECLQIADGAFRRAGLVTEHLRAQWNIARLAAACGRPDEAAASLIEINRGFVELRLFPEAALVDHDRDSAVPDGAEKVDAMSALALPFGKVLTTAELLDPAEREHHRWVRLIELYVAECISAQTVPRASELAQRVGWAPEHLSRVFRRATGVKLATALQQEQAHRAAELLIRTPLGAVKISEITGFSSAKAFYRTFRRVYGATPGTYRREGGKPIADSLPLNQNG